MKKTGDLEITCTTKKCGKKKDMAKPSPKVVICKVHFFDLELASQEEKFLGVDSKTITFPVTDSVEQMLLTIAKKINLDDEKFVLQQFYLRFPIQEPTKLVYKEFANDCALFDIPFLQSVLVCAIL